MITSCFPLKETKSTLLWEGSWGADGSDAITVGGLADYSYLIFEFGVGTSSYGTAVIQIQPVMYVENAVVFTSGAVYIRLFRFSASGETLSVVTARQIVITAAAAVSNAPNTTSVINRIWGCNEL